MKNIEFHNADNDVLTEYAKQSRRANTFNFFAIKADTEAMFYVLPPWNSGGRVARELWEGYMPNKKRWTSYQSWAYTNPDLVALDPVVGFLDELASLDGVDPLEVKRYRPRQRFYVNALVTSTRDLAQPGSPTTPFPNSKEVQVVNLPPTAWNEICAYAQRGGFETPWDPNSAILFSVSRTGRGLQTEYKVAFAGSRSATGEETPSRFNLVEAFGEEIIPIFDNLPDLDERWSPPNPNDARHMGYAEEVKRSLKNALLSQQQGIVPGAFAGPQGSVGIGGQSLPQFAAPVAPAAPTAPVAPAPVAPVTMVPAAPVAPAAPVGPTMIQGVPAPQIPQVPNVQIPDFPKS